MMAHLQDSKPGARVLWPRVLGVAVLLGLVGVVAAGVTRARGKVETTIPAGAALVGALQSTVSTEKASVGDRVELETTDPITLDERTTLPPGIVIRGEVTHAKGGGRIAGAPELTIRFTRLTVGGSDYPISAEPFRVKGRSDGGESAMQIGGGAVAGAVVGAIAGDAGKGALVGAVLGTGVAVATKGDQIVLPAGQKLRVRLADPVTVSFRPPADEESPPAA
jgi:hypothetical protein